MRTSQARPHSWDPRAVTPTARSVRSPCGNPIQAPQRTKTKGRSPPSSARRAKQAVRLFSVAARTTVPGAGARGFPASLASNERVTRRASGKNRSSPLRLRGSRNQYAEAKRPPLGTHDAGSPPRVDLRRFLRGRLRLRRFGVLEGALLVPESVLLGGAFALAACGAGVLRASHDARFLAAFSQRGDSNFPLPRGRGLGQLAAHGWGCSGANTAPAVRPPALARRTKAQISQVEPLLRSFDRSPLPSFLTAAACCSETTPSYVGRSSANSTPSATGNSG
jgi:hypothetical protein